MKRIPCPIAVCLLASLLAPALARAAATCKESTRPVIEFKAVVKPPDQVIADALARQLTVELEVRGIDLCEGSTAPQRPIGRVPLQVERNARGPTLALIRIGDEVTDKRVERTMDLTLLPPDSRPLSVAVAADELLRASWSELQMKDAPPPAMVPPQAVLAAVRTSLRPIPPASRFELGLVGSSSYFPQRTGLGAGLWLGQVLTSRWSAVYRVGMERGLTTTGAHGTVHADTTNLGAGIEYAPWTGPFGLRIGGDIRVLHVQYLVDASASGRGHDASDWAAVSGWGGRLIFDTASVRLHLGAAGLIAVRPSSASDGGQMIARVGRFGGEAILGVSLCL